MMSAQGIKWPAVTTSDQKWPYVTGGDVGLNKTFLFVSGFLKMLHFKCICLNVSAVLQQAQDPNFCLFEKAIYELV